MTVYRWKWQTVAVASFIRAISTLAWFRSFLAFPVNSKHKRTFWTSCLCRSTTWTCLLIKRDTAAKVELFWPMLFLTTTVIHLGFYVTETKFKGGNSIAIRLLGIFFQQPDAIQIWPQADLIHMHRQDTIRRWLQLRFDCDSTTIIYTSLFHHKW